ncbi:hypothetical protein RclHR1_17610008 [Rhizophagus clarus]|uniref:Uncharacterized protein n=1 Tax=Rhizophagus clarus TaxID=94130 RepID=A0A2Z6QXV9_9GLOM|nr:hypothetical protein RclHR1_17610008 [Rhizophagus clarus]
MKSLHDYHMSGTQSFIAGFTSEVISIFLIIYFFRNLVPEDILLICSSVILCISIFFSFVNEDAKLSVRELHS